MYTIDILIPTARDYEHGEPHEPHMSLTCDSHVSDC